MLTSKQRLYQTMPTFLGEFTITELAVTAGVSMKTARKYLTRARLDGLIAARNQRYRWTGGQPAPPTPSGVQPHPLEWQLILDPLTLAGHPVTCDKSSLTVRSAGYDPVLRIEYDRQDRAGIVRAALALRRAGYRV